MLIAIAMVIWLVGASLYASWHDHRTRPQRRLIAAERRLRWERQQ